MEIPTTKFDRFELEQEIIGCWKIVDDLKELEVTDESADAIAKYYNMRFERLWAIFESMTKAKKIIS